LKRLLEQNYNILDTDDGQVFMHVNHYGDESMIGNIYISDISGEKFSLSLEHNECYPG